MTLGDFTLIRRDTIGLLGISLSIIAQELEIGLLVK